MADNWWEADEAVDGAPAAGPVTLGTPRKPKPQVRQVGDQLGIVGDDGSFTPTYTAPPKAGAPGKKPSDGLTPTARATAKGKVNAANIMLRQLDRAEKLFDETLGKQRSVWEYLPTEKNKEFDAAVQGLMPLARQLFRVPGSGADTDKEAKYIENLLPDRFSYDGKNKQKFTQLREMIADILEQNSGAPAQPEKGFRVIGKR
jgi:hypothetical protein